MRRRILLIVLTAVALVVGTTATRDRVHSAPVIPWCPPICSK